MWNHFDGKEGGPKVFAALVIALTRLSTEKPAMLGVNQQMQGLGVAHHDPASPIGPYGIDVGAVAGMVARSATATVSNVVGMMSGEAGLSVAGSTMKLQWSALTPPHHTASLLKITF